MSSFIVLAVTTAPILWLDGHGLAPAHLPQLPKYPTDEPTVERLTKYLAGNPYSNRFHKSEVPVIISRYLVWHLPHILVAGRWECQELLQLSRYCASYV